MKKMYANAAIPGQQSSKLFYRFRRDLGAWILALPTLFLFIVFAWEPLVMQAVYSFFHMNGFTPGQFVGFDNYRLVLENTMFRQTLSNTVMYVLWSLVIGWPVPIIAALLINEMRRFQGFFRFAIYFPAMIPAVVTSLMWEFIYNPGSEGLLNRILVAVGLPPSQWLQNGHITILLIIVTMTWNLFGSTALLYLASLQSVSNDLYEAAAIDGAGIWQRVWNVSLPGIAPILKMLLVLQIIGVFQTFIQPLAMTEGGPNNASMTLLLSSYNYAFLYGKGGESMAVGMITFVILLVITAIYFRLTRESNN